MATLKTNIESVVNFVRVCERADMERIQEACRERIEAFAADVSYALRIGATVKFTDKRPQKYCQYTVKVISIKSRRALVWQISSRRPRTRGENPMMMCLTDIDDFDDIQAEDLPEEVENPFDFFEDDYWDHYFEADSDV